MEHWISKLMFIIWKWNKFILYEMANGNNSSLLNIICNFVEMQIKCTNIVTQNSFINSETNSHKSTWKLQNEIIFISILKISYRRTLANLIFYCPSYSIHAANKIQENHYEKQNELYENRINFHFNFIIIAETQKRKYFHSAFRIWNYNMRRRRIRKIFGYF